VLDAAKLDYRVNPRLVRGLDYYNLTVFEWVTDRLGAQGAVCGGGRYDGMFEQLGGKRTPAVGWGMGIERMLLLLEAAGVAMPAEPVDVYAIVPGPEAVPVAMVTCEALRAAGLAVQMHAAGAEGQGSMKAQFKKADASGARHALVFGPDELARGEVGLKDLRNPATAQAAVALEPVDALASRIRSAPTRPS
jgi:histidyl-tRNA synthetase